VNPKIGLGHVANKMYPAQPARSKKVAVIGGGPAGMKAALVAAERGHQVTLYEASDTLGGQLKHADYMEDKWALRNYKNYLVDQLKKSTVTLRLGTKAEPEALAQEGYDAIIAGCGSLPKVGPVPGADDPKIGAPIDCYGRESELGDQVIVIGGASTGAETALYLAENGHHVTLVSRKMDICYDNVAHGREYEVEYITHHPNMTLVTNAKTLRVENGTDVVVEVNDGPMKMDGPHGPFMPDSADEAKLGDKTKEITLHGDTVVFSAGVRPCVEECMAFAGVAPEFYIIGDANIHNEDMWRRFEMPKMAPHVGGEVRHCTATAYAAAMQL
jgi:NADPH-dependent 2,4-dienoyl-CoA reductase/sulfur reductase-like enzyme